MAADPVVQEALKSNDKWAQGFDSPLPLHAKKKLVILTCMDSRLIPEAFCGLDIGDAEVIRNAGGRVTADVLRSMVVCQELLGCERMLVIHHTDCGGQAVLRRQGEWQGKLRQRIADHASLPIKVLAAGAWYGSYLIPSFLRRAVLALVVRPIPDLVESIIDDVKLLRKVPSIDPGLKLYGLLYSTDTGKLTELCRDEGGGLVLTDAYRQAKQSNGVGESYKKTASSEGSQSTKAHANMQGAGEGAGVQHTE